MTGSTGADGGFFPTRISKDQARDSGMALTVILLLLGLFLGREGLHQIALVVLLVDMVAPRVFAPFATVWLGLSHLLGTVVSKVLLTVIFYALVLPVGLLRRLLGHDSLQLKSFRKQGGSVMRERDHVFGPADIERPF